MHGACWLTTPTSCVGGAWGGAPHEGPRGEDWTSGGEDKVTEGAPVQPHQEDQRRGTSKSSFSSALHGDEQGLPPPN